LSITFTISEEEIEEEDLLKADLPDTKKRIYLVCQVSDGGMFLTPQEIREYLSPISITNMSLLNESKKRFANFRLIAKKMNAKVRIVSN
jgi:hypothetical protein